MSFSWWNSKTPLQSLYRTIKSSFRNKELQGISSFPCKIDVIWLKGMPVDLFTFLLNIVQIAADQKKFMYLTMLLKNWSWCAYYWYSATLKNNITTLSALALRALIVNYIASCWPQCPFYRNWHLLPWVCQISFWCDCFYFAPF